MLKEVEVIREKVAILSREIKDGPPKCYSCGIQFTSKMVCHSRPGNQGKRQLRCISCAVKHGLITYTEYEFLVLGLEKHNRLTPEVIQIVKTR